MNTIPCSEQCIHQKDGYCNYSCSAKNNINNTDYAENNNGKCIYFCSNKKE